MDRRLARNLLLGATALFGVIGALSLFSIELGFLLAAAAAAVGAARLSSEKGNRDPNGNKSRYCVFRGGSVTAHIH